MITNDYIIMKKKEREKKRIISYWLTVSGDKLNSERWDVVQKTANHQQHGYTSLEVTHLETLLREMNTCSINNPMEIDVCNSKTHIE